MVDQIARKTLGDLVDARLNTISGAPTITVFRGEVPDKPPVTVTDGEPDPSGRVAPYVVTFTSAGDPLIEASLSRCGTELLWQFQTTIAAGYSADCEHSVDRVFNQLHHWTPVSAGLQFGRVIQVPGYDAGVMRRDNDTQPPRFWLPLLWQLPIHL